MLLGLLLAHLVACDHRCGGIREPVCVDTSPSDDTQTDTSPPAHPFYSSTSGWVGIASGYNGTSRPETGVQRSGSLGQSPI